MNSYRVQYRNYYLQVEKAREASKRKMERKERGRAFERKECDIQVVSSEDSSDSEGRARRCLLDSVSN